MGNSDDIGVVATICIDMSYCIYLHAYTCITSICCGNFSLRPYPVEDSGWVAFQLDFDKIDYSDHMTWNQF